MGGGSRNSNDKVVFRIDTDAKCNTLILHSYQLLAHTGQLIFKSSSKTKADAMFEILDIAQENVFSGTTAETLGLIVHLDSKEDCVQNADNSETQCVPVGLARKILHKA